jgi:carbohydrate kinase (thermoresistant glucokinase family)
MGVAGVGKTTLAKALAERLGWTFQEGDDLHPPANIAKMRSGAALDDADRAPWLQTVAKWIADQLARQACAVISCSALKRRYREVVVGDRDAVLLVYLQGHPDLVASRLQGRRGHFMPASLSASQFAALEPPGPAERAIVVDAAQPLEAQVDTIVKVASLQAR